MATVNYRYGIRGARTAKQLAPGTYMAPVPEPGAESITEARGDSNSTSFFSDDGNQATVNGAGSNDTLDIQFAELSDHYKTELLGHRVDSTTGALLKSKDDEGSTFAFGYEVQGTQRKTRVWKLGCTSSEPAAAAHQTNNEGVTESPETCTLTVGGDTFSGESFYEMVCHEGEPGFATFLDAVPTPDPSTSGVKDVTLASLSLTDVALSPVFNPSISSYVGTTEATSTTVTATPADEDATVTVNGGEAGAVALESGENVISVVVRNDGKIGTYTVVVTK